MPRAARAVHEANPTALILLSGFSFDTNLSFLARSPLHIVAGSTLDRKIVYEVHWYAWSSHIYEPDDAELHYRKESERMFAAAGFLMVGSKGDLHDDPDVLAETAAPAMPETFSTTWTNALSALTALWAPPLPELSPPSLPTWTLPRPARPLLLTEFGANLDTYPAASSREKSSLYLMSVQRWLHEHPTVGWALWGVQGSYYMREGVVNRDESFGLLSADWSAVRSPRFVDEVLASLLG